MKKLFYKKLTENLNNNKDVYVITIVKATEEKYIGNKILKANDELIFENDEYKDFYKEIIKNVDFKSCGEILRINDNVDVFVEHITTKPQLVICGGGHIALSLSHVGKMLDYSVTVIDDREEFANYDRFPMADNIICCDYEEAFEKVSFNNNSYFVIVTRGHKADKTCLGIILKNRFKYVGMIGSRAKVATVVSQLLKEGYKKEDIDKAHTPIGLKIGAQTPAEIAISIAAEIIEVKNKSNVFNIDEEILNSINEKDSNMVLATILDKRGSSPRGVGANMLVFEDNSFIGTIGGGSVENAAYEEALRLIKEKKSHMESYDLSNSAAAKLGMACGGQIKVLFEYIRRGLRMKIVDGKGKNCPMPVIMAKKEIDNGEKIFVVEVDNKIAVENLKKLANSQGFEVKTSEDNGIYKVVFNGSCEECDEILEKLKVRNDKIGNYAVFIGKDIIGAGNEELGKSLMKMFFYTISQEDNMPKYLLFMNDGVKVPTLNEQAVEHLKDLENEGVEILVCGACLNFYGLEEKLLVGKISNMYDITTAMKNVDKVITL